ncbi:uncharacterized protein METZ01_LOCUS360976 [marine metagenome]|uniref:DAPG hydrolase PhiG domain-containing protein n=1 Tax=marine metagenome TaxID=408172 RepID=A0A382SEW5_9ZZZZ
MKGSLFFSLLLLITFALVIQFKLPSRQNSLQDFNYPNLLKFKPGVQRLRDGTIEVSSLVNMPDVTSNMFKWWFSDYLQTSEHYKMWHPEDHIWMDWDHKEPGKIIGSHHLVHEYIGGELNKLRIQFAWPQEILGYDPNDENTVVLCARVGELDSSLNIAEMCHVAQNTSWGVELRSRFWLGVVSDREAADWENFLLSFVVNNPISRRFTVSGAQGIALQKHCIEEMSYLADLLPTIYNLK